MSGLLMEQLHFAKGIDPVADAFEATVRSDVYNIEGWNRALFVVYCGVGTTGTSTITVNACDNVTPSTRSAIAFHYRALASGDTEGAITAATATGYLTIAGSSKIILVEVRGDALASLGYGFVELTLIQSVDSPVVGSVLFIAGEPRYRPGIAATVIV